MITPDASCSPAEPRGDASAAPNERLAFWLVLLIVAAVRVPFLNAGYGNDPDAWSVANAAREIASTGQYVASRLPGSPLQELVCSLIWRGGPAALNGLTAVLSVIAVGSFMKTMRRLGSRDHLLAGLALGLTPVVFVYSTATLDYVWALALILLSLHCAVGGRAVLAGGLLGLAIGCRVTSGAMLLPLAVLVAAGRPRSEAWTRVAELSLVAVCLGAACYIPVAQRYGWAFLSFSEPAEYPSVTTMLSRGLLRVWGPLGLVGILAGLLVAAFRTRLAATEFPRPAVIAAAVGIGLYVIAFLRLPLEEGYLIPAVPFVILLLGRIMTPGAFRLTCAVLCLSPFVCGAGRMAVTPAETLSAHACTFTIRGQEFFLDPLRGPVVRDYAERLHGMSFVDGVLAHSKMLPPRSVVVVGYWLPQIQARTQSMPLETDAQRIRYIYLIDRRELEQSRQSGIPVYYLPEMAAFNREKYGVDLAGSGAEPLNEYWRR